MIDRIFSLLKGDVKAAASETRAPSGLQVAVGALLVEAARRDDVFNADEQDAIKRLLAERFDLSPDDTQGLFDVAEETSANSGQLFGFTNKVVKELDEAERVHVIEMLWEVAYADGVLDPHEDAMIRRVAGLVYVSDFDRGAARRRVLLEKLNIKG
ncbi:MAG: TerB family tellurite resistance protein [Rhodospirillaceae bacterium]|nr:TerB family tellurite resistance protein [Rhodospirillaceae bacterium]